MVVKRLNVKQPPGIPPPPVRKWPGRVKTGFKWLRVVFRIWFWTFTTVAFMLFICEESTQLLGFSRMHYKSMKTLEAYQIWVKDCQRDKVVAETMHNLAIKTYWLNPISSKVFRRYFEQELIKIGRELWVGNRLIAEAKGKENAKLERVEAAAELVATGIPTKKLTMTMSSVYATASGRTYHRPTCHHLFRNNKQKTGIRQFTIASAKAAKLSDCSRCRPGR